MKVTLRASKTNLNIGVNYSKEIELSDKEINIPFIVETLKQEVTTGNESQQKKKLKQLKKIQKRFVSILGATGMSVGMFLSSSKVANAQELPYTPTQSGDVLNAEVIQNWGITISALVVGIGILMALVLLGAAGIWRMFRKQREASAWTTDIIKGLVQVLVAVPIVYGLYHLSQIILNSLPTLSITY